MKISAKWYIHLLCFLMLVTISSVAQDSKPSDQNVPQYDPAKEQTLIGTVEAIKDYQCPVTGTTGAHLTVKSEGGIVEVHLAPEKFLKEYDIHIKQGDRVKVVGNRVTLNGKDAMIAKSVTVQQDTYSFRDKRGRPLW